MINEKLYNLNKKIDAQNIVISTVLRILYIALPLIALFMFSMFIQSALLGFVFGYAVAAFYWYTFWPVDTLIQKLTQWNSERQKPLIPQQSGEISWP